MSVSVGKKLCGLLSLFVLYGLCSLPGNLFGPLSGGVKVAFAKDIAYLSAELDRGYPWRDGFSVILQADQALCKKKYGKNWENSCYALLGEYGAPVRGISLKPEVRGQWTWENGTYMRFLPEEPLQPSTRYTVDFSALSLPAHVRLAATSLILDSLPQAVSSSPEKLWIDPSPKGAHALSLNLSFLYPVNPQDMAAKIRLKSLDPAAGLRFAPPELVWNYDKTEVSINARIESLPRTRAQAEVSVQGLPAFVLEQGVVRLLPPRKNESFRYEFSVSGSDQLFRITKMSLDEVADENLGQKYVLHLETSLHVRPDEVLKALQVLQLPRTNGPEAGTAYNWAQAPALASADIKGATRLQVVPVKPGNEAVSKMQFWVPATEGSYVLAFVPASLSTPSGVKLGKPQQQILHAAKHQARLELLQAGHVLPLGGAQKLDIYSTGLTAYKWTVAQVRDPFMALLASNGTSFEYGPVVSVELVSEIATGSQSLVKGEAGSPQFSVLDVRPLLQDAATSAKDADAKGGKRGLMQLSLTGLDGEKNVTQESRFLLVTDLGLMLKKNADGSSEAFVHSLSKGEAVAGAKVQILGANGLAVVSAQSNAQGRASLASVSGLSKEKKPVAVVAFAPANSATPGDMAWLPLEDSKRRVDYANFPVAGRSSAADGINAYVFSQRGMFRPGEKLHFGCLIKRTDWAALPSDLPLRAVLVNPAGTQVMQQNFTVGRDGLHTLSWDAPIGAPTGRYRLDIQWISSSPTEDDGEAETLVLGTGTVRVEEFQPDTLALQARFSLAGSNEDASSPKRKGWFVLPANANTIAQAASPVRTVLNLQNLHGLPAADHRIRASLTVMPATLRFAGYEDFLFYDAKPYQGEVLQESLPEVRTDAQGKAALPLPLDRVRAGTMRCSVLLEGFEASGGRAVSWQDSVLLSPLEWMVGYRSGGAATNLHFIPQGQQGYLDFVAVDSSLKSIQSESLSFVLSERRYVTSLVSDASGQYRYDDLPVDKEIARSTQTIAADKGLRWPIPTADAGDYLLTLRNKAGESVTSIPFSVAGTALRTGTDLPASALRARLDKSEYQAGETIKVFLSLPYDGTGLLTIERDGVAAHTWFKARAGDSVHSIDLPKDFEGRGYVNVSFVRALNSPNIYMKPYAYAVVPFSANIARRDMGLSLKAPALVQPGESVKVSLHAAQPGKVVLFAVDEGVLQLTRFASPSPLDYLLRDRALQVQTLHAFDLLMADHAQLKGRIPGFGGDMTMLGGRFLNPFKRRAEPPLATWAVMDVPAGESVSTFTVPDYYNGKVRIMAVGSGPDSSGSAEASLTVRGPLIISPQLPLVVAPRDSFEGAVVLSNGAGPGRKVRLQMESGAGLKLSPQADVVLDIPEHGSVVHTFQAQVQDVLGESIVRFSAQDVKQGDTASAPPVVRDLSLSVRPATALRTTQQAGRSQHSQSGPVSLDLPVARSVYPYRAESVLSLSALPLPAVRGMVRYLDSYPYGCTEQLISKALPYVLLSNRPDLLADANRSPEQVRKQAEDCIAAAVQALHSGLRPGQGIAPWPEGEASDLVSVYAGDFLLTLRETGRGLPAGLVEAVFDALEQTVSRSPATLEQARIQAYGIWVLTREGRITTQAMERLVQNMDERLPEWKSDVTASLLAGACALMRMDNKAQELIRGYSWNARTFTPAESFTPLAAQALHMAVLARHFPDKLGKGAGDAGSPVANMAENMVDSVMNALQGPHAAGSTFSSALGVRALLALPSAYSGTLEKVRLACVEGGPTPAPTAYSTEGLLLLSAPLCTRYRVEIPENAPNAAPVTLFWHISTQGFDRTVPAKVEMQGMEVRRRYLDAAGQVLAPNPHVALGDTIKVELQARAHGGAINNVVLLDLLPGGFEIVIPSADSPADAVQDNREGAQGLIRAERRDDRVIVFANLGTGDFSYTYTLRAVSKGRFSLPPVQGEAMYNQQIRANSAAGTVEVF